MYFWGRNKDTSRRIYKIDFKFNFFLDAFMKVSQRLFKRIKLNYTWASRDFPKNDEISGKISRF